MADVFNDKINHPAHYGGDSPYEAIKVIEAWALGFCLGNAIKYICRAGKKLEGTYLQDLKKARWYLDREINRIEGSGQGVCETSRDVGERREDYRSG